MYESVKKFAEVTGLVAAVLIFLGLCRMHAFYSHYHINIVSYLDFTEILLSIFSDLTALLIMFILIVIGGVVWLVSFSSYVFLMSRIRPDDPKVKKNIFESMQTVYNEKANRRTRVILAALGFALMIGMFLTLYYSGEAGRMLTGMYWNFGDIGLYKFLFLMGASSFMMGAITGQFKSILVTMGFSVWSACFSC